MNRIVITMHSPRINRWVAMSGCVAILGTAACSSSGPTAVACTGDPVYGLAITVENAATGAPVTDSASVVISDGSYVESYHYLGAAGQPASGTIHAASERAGTYNISIRKSGYAAYDTAGVNVTKDACHVQPVQVIAKLDSVTAG